MRPFFILIFIVTATFSILRAQPPHLEIEGDARIMGDLELEHRLDSTSLFVGRNAGIHYITDDAHRNTVLGVHLPHSIASGGPDNTMVGYETGLLGSYGVFIGVQAGTVNRGTGNTFSGYRAGYSNRFGAANTFLGYRSGFNSEGGSYNTAVGYDSGAGNKEGASNVFIGANVGQQNGNGTRNTFLGRFADRDQNGPDSLDRAIAIGYQARAACNNCALIGGTGEHAVQVGIGVGDPEARLHIHEVNNTRLKISNDNSKEIMIDLIRNDDNAKDRDWRLRNAATGDFELAYHATDLEHNIPSTVVRVDANSMNPGNSSIELGESNSRWRTVWAESVQLSQLIQLQPISEPVACKSGIDGSIYYDKTSRKLRACTDASGAFKWVDLH